MYKKFGGQNPVITIKKKNTNHLKQDVTGIVKNTENKNRTKRPKIYIEFEQKLR